MAKKDKGESVSLPSTVLKKITETASSVACEAYRREAEKVRQENRDKRLYNTRLLMEKYRGLVKYSDDAVYDASHLDGDEDMQLHELIELMSEGRDSFTLSVDSIRERVGRTRIILRHMNKMLEFYQYRCQSSGKLEIQRKWDTINYLYLTDEEKTVAELAKMFYVDERTVYRYNKAALQDLSALFFGCIE